MIRKAALCMLALCACPEDKPKADDRLIQKLQAEQERIAKSGKPAPVAPAPGENPIVELSRSEGTLKLGAGSSIGVPSAGLFATNRKEPRETSAERSS